MVRQAKAVTQHQVTPRATTAGTPKGAVAPLCLLTLSAVVPCTEAALRASTWGEPPRPRYLTTALAPLLKIYFINQL